MWRPAYFDQIISFLLISLYHLGRIFRLNLLRGINETIGTGIFNYINTRQAVL